MCPVVPNRTSGDRMKRWADMGHPCLIPLSSLKLVWHMMMVDSC